MELQSNSKIGPFLSQTPVWQRFPASVIFFYSTSLISAAIVYRLRYGGWEMDWAIQLEDMLYASNLVALVWTWQTRKGSRKNEQDEQQRSQH
jgi:hypothetical protein